MVHGDIRDRASLERAMTKVDVVFHLAAKSRVLDGTQDPDGVFQTNVIGTHEVLRAAAVNGVKRVIFTSSREVYGDATSIPVQETAPLFIDKKRLWCEQSCRRVHWQTILLRRDGRYYFSLIEYLRPS